MILPLPGSTNVGNTTTVNSGTLTPSGAITTGSQPGGFVSEGSTTPTFYGLVTETAYTNDGPLGVSGYSSPQDIDGQMRNATGLAIAPDRANVDTARTFALDGGYTANDQPGPTSTTPTGAGPAPSTQPADSSWTPTPTQNTNTNSDWTPAPTTQTPGTGGWTNNTPSTGNSNDGWSSSSPGQNGSQTTPSSTQPSTQPDRISDADAARTVSERNEALREQERRELEEAAASRTREQHEQDLEDRKDQLSKEPRNQTDKDNLTNDPKRWDDKRDLTEVDRANGKTVTNADGTVSEGVGTSPKHDPTLNPNDPNNPNPNPNPNDPNNPGNWDPKNGDPQNPNPNPNPFDPSQVTPTTGSGDPFPQPRPGDQEPGNRPHDDENKPDSPPQPRPDAPPENKPDTHDPREDKPSDPEHNENKPGHDNPIDFNPQEPKHENEQKPEKPTETIPEPPQDKTEHKQNFEPRTNAEQVAADLAMMEMIEGALMSHRQNTHHADVIEQLADNKNDQDYSHALDPLVSKASDSMAMLQDMVADYVQPIVDQPQHVEETAKVVEAPKDQIMDLVGQGLDQLLHHTQGTEANSTESPAMTPEQMDIANIIAGLTSGRLVADPSSLSVDELTSPDQFGDMGAKIVQALSQNDFNQALSNLGGDNDQPIAGNNPIDLITNALSNGSDGSPFGSDDLIASVDPSQMELANPLASEWDPETMAQKYRDMLEDKREQDEKERRAREEALREEEAKRYAAAMLAALKARQYQEEADRIRAQKDLLNLETRQKYVVLPGDTLESIAQKKLMNRRLSALLYEINRSRIPIVTRDGKKLLQLKPRIVLFLPTQMEVKRFNTRLFGRTNEKFEYDTECSDKSTPRSNPGLIMSGSRLSNKATAPADTAESGSENNQNDDTKNNVVPLNAKRKANIEALLGKMSEAAPDDGRIRYVCRLGDTLRSIAMRHPALKDVALWRLVAEINNISTQTDRKGVPLAELKRAQTIVLPLPAEIAEFKEQQKSSAAASHQTKAPATEVSKPCPKCNRLIVGSICAPCARSSEQSKAQPKAYINTPEQSAETIDLEAPAAKLPDYNSGHAAKQLDDMQDATTSLLKAAGFKPIESQARTGTDNAEARTQRNVITVISEDCRIVSFGSQENSSAGFRARLEYKQQEFWLPVILYEINDGTSWRHEYNLNGGRKSSRIELPPSQAKQLADNDLAKNWDNYLKKFLRV